MLEVLYASLTLLYRVTKQIKFVQTQPHKSQTKAANWLAVSTSVRTDFYFQFHIYTATFWVKSFVLRDRCVVAVSSTCEYSTLYIIVTSELGSLWFDFRNTLSKFICIFTVLEERCHLYKSSEKDVYPCRIQVAHRMHLWLNSFKFKDLPLHCV